jgi:exosortase
MSSTLAAQSQKEEVDQKTPWYLICALTAVMIWTFWSTIDGLIGIWRNPQYSHGYLVPIFTIALLVMRRQPFQPVSFWARWSGVGIIILGLAMRLLGAQIHNGVVEMWAIIPVLMGIFTVAGGWSMLRWAAAPLAFLIFMMPVPEHVADMFLAPLQKAATVFSCYTLQTLGVDSYYVGNRIIIGEGFPLNIEEQCSGLRMCTIFLAMAVAMTMITERPLWQNAIVILSAIPIALAVNLIRIVITALLYLLLGPESALAKHFFHDLAGWFMMPLAFLFLYVEMQILDHILVEESSAVPVIVGFGKSPAMKQTAPTQIR